MTRFIVFALAMVAGAGSAAAQSTARTIRIPSADIGQRVFSVLLPTAYDQSTARYPVLYLLHGGGQDHTAFMARRDFARRARVVDMIVVMPAADRGGTTPALVTRYEDFLARELVAYVDANFRTLAAPSARAIAGLSQGGMFAIATGLRYPDVFGIVGAFSAAAPRSEQPVPAENVTTHASETLANRVMSLALRTGDRFERLLPTGPWRRGREVLSRHLQREQRPRQPPARRVVAAGQRGARIP